MNALDLTSLLPLIIIATTSIIVMLVIPFYRNHKVTAALTMTGLAVAFISIFMVSSITPRRITALLIIDDYALFFTGLIFAAGFAVALLSYGYLEKQELNREEFYLLLLLSLLGAGVLVSSSHFASLFLGLEILSVSLYALFAYLRNSPKSIEAGVKYLVLAAASAAILLFGMALVYAELGTMEFVKIASWANSPDISKPMLLAGIGMIIIGIGFKLALVPFHMWTPDVYEGAPAPVTAFVATVSKGAVFALLLRYFTQVDVHTYKSLFLIFAIIAIASMFVGNLLALFQTNVKRILAYSSIAHLGYLLVAFLASGKMAVVAVAYYLAAYFITTIGAFGVISVLSMSEKEAAEIDDYRGLAWHRPWITGIFTAMLLSLAGIPLTAGFLGKFYVISAGIESSLWLLVLTLIINSAIGLFYYLRVIVAMFTQAREGRRAHIAALSLSGGIVLTLLTLLLIWLGVYPSPLIELIQKTVIIIM